jgi:SAM-dependent methyltransferase
LTVLEGVRCPRCEAPLDVCAEDIRCAECRQSFPRLGRIPVLLPAPDAYLSACRAQLSLLERSADETAGTIRQQMTARDTLPSTGERCAATIDALHAQLADVRGILSPLLPPPSSHRASATRVPATIEYLHYLYRDWGWPAQEDGENERALGLVESVAGAGALGRTLVVGAGGCRLAYDLHRRHAGTETVAVDLDPLLFTAAHAVVRGGTVVIREANLEAGELAQSCRAWELRAAGEPVGEDSFHFLLSDGVEPPFAAGSFDTVVTPWFVDQGPPDVRDFISSVHRLLAPAGRWLNLGPLLYEPGVPIGLRFGREELFDLAARAGFRVDRWQTDSVPYLVSRLNGRGKVEWVLAFCATRLETKDAGPELEGGPPPWLIFNHIPVPTFPGQRVATGPRGYELVLSAIDGKRTVNDIAKRIQRQAQGADATLSEIRAAVRGCLMEVHPACTREAR